MRFKEFLAEVDDKADDEAPTFAEVMLRDCGPFMKQSQRNGLLFRGITGYGDLQGKIKIGDETVPYYKKKVRKDRNPLSTKGPVHKIIDDWFEEEMGMRARSQAIFCYGETGREIAAGYGDRTVVFPIGKFIYCWSPKVKDLYDVIIEKFEGDKGSIKKAYIGSDGKPDYNAVAETMNSLGYTINGFNEAVADNCEIMIECDEYYVIPYKDVDFLSVIKSEFVKA